MTEISGVTRDESSMLYVLVVWVVSQCKFDYQHVAATSESRLYIQSAVSN